MVLTQVSKIPTLFSNSNIFGSENQMVYCFFRIKNCAKSYLPDIQVWITEQ